jgi:hypothetical protein
VSNEIESGHVSHHKTKLESQMTRELLPNCRRAETFSFYHEGVKYHASVGRFSDNSIAELFLNAGKIGSPVHNMARSAAVVFSISRRFGVPLGIICDALPKLKDGSPACAVGVALKMANEQ